MVGENTEMKYRIVDLDGTLIHLQTDWSKVKDWVSQQIKPLGFKYDKKIGLDENLFAVKAANPGRFNFLMKNLAALEQEGLDSAPVNQKLIEELRGQKWALLTLNVRSTALAALARMDLKPELIIAKEDVKAPKPDPDGALQILRKLHWSAEETVFLGDSERDEGCAKGAGIQFLRVKF
jgi:phosphoglycolate phosphatase